MNYRKDEIQTNSYLDYSFLDEKGETTWKNGNRACFAEIFLYGQIPSNSKLMVIQRPFNLIPYDPSAIMWFVMEIKELGFPIEVKVEKGEVWFVMPLDQYKKKLHLKATATLTRCLWEDSISKVANNYFGIIEKTPELDRFIALQKAHKTSSWGLTSHAAVAGAQANLHVSRKLFWERMEKTHRGVFDSGCNNYQELNELFYHGDVKE